MSDEILDIAHGNPRLAAELRNILRTLLDHKSEKIREMARDVLDGSSLREAARSRVYGEEVGDAIGQFWTTYQNMPPEERAKLENETRERFGEL